MHGKRMRNPSGHPPITATKPVVALAWRYTGVQGATEWGTERGYITEGHRGLQRVTEGCRGLQRGTEGYRGGVQRESAEGT